MSGVSPWFSFEVLCPLPSFPVAGRSLPLRGAAQLGRLGEGLREGSGPGCHGHGEAGCSWPGQLLSAPGEADKARRLGHPRPGTRRAEPGNWDSGEPRAGGEGAAVGAGAGPTRPGEVVWEEGGASRMPSGVGGHRRCRWLGSSQGKVGASVLWSVPPLPPPFLAPFLSSRSVPSFQPLCLSLPPLLPSLGFTPTPFLLCLVDRPPWAVGHFLGLLTFQPYFLSAHCHLGQLLSPALFSSHLHLLPSAVCAFISIPLSFL